MTAVFWLIDTILDLYFWIVISWVVLSWLFVFGIVNSYSRVVMVVRDFLNAVTAPVFRPISRQIPPLGGLDLTPLIVLLGISFIQIILRTSIAPLFGVGYY